MSGMILSSSLSNRATDRPNDDFIYGTKNEQCQCGTRQIVHSENFHCSINLRWNRSWAMGDRPPHSHTIRLMNVGKKKHFIDSKPSKIIMNENALMRMRTKQIVGNSKIHCSFTNSPNFYIPFHFIRQFHFPPLWMHAWLYVIQYCCVQEWWILNVHIVHVFVPVSVWMCTNVWMATRRFTSGNHMIKGFQNLCKCFVLFSFINYFPRCSNVPCTQTVQTSSSSSLFGIEKTSVPIQ